MKKLQFLTVAILFFISMLFIGIIPATAEMEPQVSSTSVMATKDAHVDESNPDSNYGSSNTFYIGRGLSGKLYESYFYFPLNDIPDDDAEISIDILAVYEDMSLTVTLITENWNENSITWNNKPTHGEIITTFYVAAAQFYTIDVSDYIEGDSLSICINATYSGVSDYIVGYTSEWGSDDSKPQITFSGNDDDDDEDDEEIDETNEIDNKNNNVSFVWDLSLIIVVIVVIIFCIASPVLIRLAITKDIIEKIRSKKPKPIGIQKKEIDKSKIVKSEPEKVIIDKSEEKSSIRFCPYCGVKILSNAKHCDLCGKNVSD